MIIPVNDHFLIEPLVHESFISTQKDTYEEIGTVLQVPRWLQRADPAMEATEFYPNVGDKVYFDSWLAARYPKEKEGEYYWLVKWSDVRAVEYVEVPK